MQENGEVGYPVVAVWKNFKNYKKITANQATPEDLENAKKLTRKFQNQFNGGLLSEATARRLGLKLTIA
jgi:hypothetical protein